ncbi:MAG: hypothetical protein QXD05_00070 [Candidatus Pacearchaeota archaeon]
MRAASFKYSLILFNCLLIINLLFPPYKIENERKFFDFLFNDDQRYFYAGYNKTYLVTNRKLNKEDSTYAIKISKKILSDTIYKYKQIKTFPQFNPKYNKRTNKGLFELEKFGYDQEILEIIFKKPPEYYKKIVDTIIHYPQYKITKPVYIQTTRIMDIRQLIFQIIISFCTSVLFYLIISIKEE